MRPDLSWGISLGKNDLFILEPGYWQVILPWHARVERN